MECWNMKTCHPPRELYCGQSCRISVTTYRGTVSACTDSRWLCPALGKTKALGKTAWCGSEQPVTKLRWTSTPGGTSLSQESHGIGPCCLFIHILQVITWVRRRRVRKKACGNKEPAFQWAFLKRFPTKPPPFFIVKGLHELPHLGLASRMKQEPWDMLSLAANPSFTHQVYMLMVLSSDLKNNKHNHLRDAFPNVKGCWLKVLVMLTPETVDMNRVPTTTQNIK